MFELRVILTKLYFKTPIKSSTSVKLTMFQTCIT